MGHLLLLILRRLLLGGVDDNLLRGRAALLGEQLARLNVTRGLVKLATTLRLHFCLLGDRQRALIVVSKFELH